LVDGKTCDPFEILAVGIEAAETVLNVRAWLHLLNDREEINEASLADKVF